MCCHWHQGDEIPEHVRILQMGLWVPLLSVDEAWKQDWIPDEEYWSVVANKIPITLLSVELYCKSSGISGKEILQII